MLAQETRLRLTLMMLWFFLAAAAVCPDEDTIVVSSASHNLQVCEGGKEVQRYDVALGQGGLDKHKQGDEKTPLGTYSLAAPRPSALFGTFILVGYPTAAQKQAGDTGSAVGIHGPPRDSRLAGHVNVESDWTWGCIAVESDAAIGAISDWLRKHPSAKVTIH